MTNLINLNKARKVRLKQEKARVASQNRLTFGLSAKVRKAEKERQAREAQHLDGHALNSRQELKKD